MGCINDRYIPKYEEKQTENEKTVTNNYKAPQTKCVKKGVNIGLWVNLYLLFCYIFMIKNWHVSYGYIPIFIMHRMEGKHGKPITMHLLIGY